MKLFEQALMFATEKHSGQVRKTNSIPFILHPMEVAAIVGTITGDEEVLSAALLHDTVEDAGVTLKELEEKFGTRVMKLVESETENKRWDIPAEQTWRIRKEESLQVLKNSEDIGVKIVWLGDKLSNMRSFHRAYLKKGNALWQSFHQSDVSQQQWYYTTVATYLSDLKEYDAYREYIDLLKVVFPKINGGNFNGI